MLYTRVMNTPIIILVLIVTVSISIFSINNYVQAQMVPDWVKNTAKWYGDDQISEVEFLNAIKFLIENNVIVIDLGPDQIVEPTQDNFPLRSEVLIPNGNAEQSNTGFYIPLNLEVPIGTTVVWVNDDNVGHTVQSADDDGNPLGIFNSDLLQTGQRFAHKFDESGVYNYYCTIHPWRVGVITVK